MVKTISLKTSERQEFIDITAEVRKAVRESGVESGLCTVFVPHTTAGVTINEGADPAVRRDIMSTLSRLVPKAGEYAHQEGNSDAHIKSTLVGSSVTIIVEKGALFLGTWQAIYFCEFDGSRERKVQVKILGIR